MATPAPAILQGVGIGLRAAHYADIEDNKPNIPWFEVLSDNYFCEGDANLRHLEKIRESYPVTLHGVGMSIGSTDPLNSSYLKKLKNLIHLVEPHLVSDHLCWTSFGQQYFHELLPLPYTQEAIRHVVSRIQFIQDFLQQRIMIENVSSYLSYQQSEMTEWQFLQEVAEKADCLILLDINNIYVSAANNGFKAEDYLQGVPPQRVAQMHLAGFQDCGTHLLDAHNAPVYPDVWRLYERALEKFGPLATTIEWDNQIPNFTQLQQEASLAQALMDLNSGTS